MNTLSPQTTVTISRNTDTTNPLTVDLSSNDTTEALVPASATIPAGQSSVTVDLDAVDDAIVDGTQTVTISGTAAGHADDSDTVIASELDLRVRRALDRCRVMEIEVLLWRDAAYPSQLRDLADPPPILFTRGRIELLRTRSQLVTIVGSRHCTGYGRRTAETIADRLAGRGIIVVSGLALGIDGAAHRGALAANGDTIAVLGSGVDLIQPASHRRLGERVVREGLLMSEFLPEEPARAHHFPRRNRILAALSGATVVVEAAHKSGALITVEHALDVGRDVYVVPGPLDAPQSRGCNALIQQGAHLITSPDDFVRDLGLVCGSSKEFRDRQPTGLDADAGRVWHVLDERPAAIDDLAGRAALDTSGALAALTSLELDGWVIQEPGMRFRRAS